MEVPGMTASDEVKVEGLGSSVYLCSLGLEICVNKWALGFECIGVMRWMMHAEGMDEGSVVRRLREVKDRGGVGRGWQ